MRVRRAARLTGGGPIWDERVPRTWEASALRPGSIPRADLLMALDDTLRDIAAARHRGDLRSARRSHMRASRYARRLPASMTRRQRLVLTGLARELWPHAAPR
ncbi:hypothetical protein [Streptomyces sp. NPDC059909]|uniref:hypothetical protein n=1 Tax=Streptomyces sp. NPDC059909 TaxID=3346998 RepID=UPI00366831E8